MKQEMTRQTKRALIRYSLRGYRCSRQLMKNASAKVLECEVRMMSGEGEGIKEERRYSRMCCVK